MIISSNDIKKRDFRKSLRGYDVDEVDAFLETVSSHYEKLLIENRNQAEKIKSLLQDIDIYRENELNLQKAIVKSHDLGEEIIANAKRQSDVIIREAELESRNIKQNIEDEILAKKQELEEIKQKNEKTFEDLKNYLSDKLNELEEFYKNRKIIKMELTNFRNLSSVSTSFDPTADAKDDEHVFREMNLPKKTGGDSNKPFDENFEMK
ncbi:MAG: DivIVA domain-containing protein, partial [Ignavibacteria bacterium]|nr:DivIVA domain-containing protein [Ignavibacteria bacterium]